MTSLAVVSARARHTVCTICLEYFRFDWNPVERPSYKWNSGRPIAIQTVQSDWKHTAMPNGTSAAQYLNTEFKSLTQFLFFFNLIIRNLILSLPILAHVGVASPKSCSHAFSCSCSLMYNVSASLVHCALACSSAPPELSAIAPSILLLKSRRWSSRVELKLHAPSPDSSLPAQCGFT